MLPEPRRCRAAVGRACCGRTASPPISPKRSEHLDSPTNQQFVVLDDDAKARLAEHASFGFWELAPDGRTVVRFATSWATRPEAVDELLALL